MSFLSDNGGGAGQIKPDYVGLPIMTSVSTLPIPIVGGINKIAPNIIWLGDYAVQTQTQGGKGGDEVTGYTYSVSLIFALCEGPLPPGIGIGRIWSGSDVDLLQGVSASELPTEIQGYLNTMSSAGLTVGGTMPFSLFTGTTPQSPWSFLTSKHASQALGYPGLVYLAVANYGLGSSPTVDNFNVEVFGLHWGTAPNGLDADPALFIQDFLTSTQWGAQFPSDLIDTTTLLSGSDASTTGDGAFQTYCKALGVGFSPALTTVETAISCLQRWCKLFNTAAVWSRKTLRFIPYGDTSLSGSGVVYTPDVTPVYDLTDDDYVFAEGEDPVEMARIDLPNAKNILYLEIADRSNSYNLLPVPARDETLVNLYGRRADAPVTAHEIGDSGTAAILGQIMLQRQLYIRRTITIKLSWEYCLLEPMDLVTITDPVLKYVQKAFRVTTIEEDDQGILTVTLEEYPAGIATATQYPKQAKSQAQVNYNAPASAVNTPVIFEPQSSLTGGDAEVWIGVSGGTSSAADPNWGGCYVWLSPDGTTYQNIGTIQGPARQGVLTAALAAYAGSNPDNTDTLGVDLTMSGGQLANATTAAAAAAQTLFYADGEIMSYATATLTSASHYNLTGLYRGLYGTSPAAHGTGSQFLRLDGAIFKYPLPGQYVGKTLYLKFQSFNIWGAGVQDLSTCTEYTYGPNGEGYLVPAPAGSLTVSATIPSAPTGLVAAGGQNIIVVNWGRNPEADVLGYIVWSAEGEDSNFADAAIVAQVSALTWTHANLGYGETRSYWVEAYSMAGSSSPTGPVMATTAYTIPIEAIGANAISNNQLIPILQQQIANIEAVAQGAVVAAAQATSAQALIAIEQTVRATADDVLASQITTVQASLNGSIATVQANLTTEVSSRETLASSLTTVSTTVAGQSASIAANTASINGATARYTVQVEYDTNGHAYIGGFGLIGGSDGAGGIAFNATFLVTSFTIAQLNSDGTTSTVAPFYVSDGTVYIQDALIGELAANKITSGTISTANIVVNPASSSDGLTVYQYGAGGNTKIMDTAVGLYPNTATLLPNATASNATLEWNTPAGSPLVDLGAQNYIGRFAIIAIHIAVDSSVYDGTEQGFQIHLLIDGAEYAVWNLTAGGTYAVDLAVSGATMGAGTHDIKLTGNSGNGGGSNMNASTVSLTVCDFKA